MVNEVKELFDFVNSGGMPVYSGSRAASSQQQEPREDERITEMINRVLVSRPARKYTDLSSKQETHESDSEPVVIELGGNSKAGSVSSRGINEVKELFDFISGNRY